MFGKYLSICFVKRLISDFCVFYPSLIKRRTVIIFNLKETHMKIYSKVCLLGVLSFMLMSCGAKKAALAPAVESSITTTTNIKGEKVSIETMEMSGIEVLETLNEDGTDIIERPYKWYAGIGEADDKQVAIEIAQREAYATISRVLNNAVLDQSERGNLLNNGSVEKAITSHWEQVSSSLQKACEPLGSISIEYNPNTGMFTATAKIGVRGDLFNQLLNTAGAFKPSDLSEEELEQFIQVNKSIMEAARN